MIQHAYRFRQYKMAAPTKMIHSVAARANVVGGIPFAFNDLSVGA